jgi:hypothetical protein
VTSSPRISGRSIAVPIRTRFVAAAIAAIGTTASRVMRVSATQIDSKPAASAFCARRTISEIDGAPRNASPIRSVRNWVLWT